MQMQNNNVYDFHPAVAVLYDEYFIEQDDVEFIRRLIGERSGWHILEPFCGTGRILLDLAGKGHFVFGIDQAEHFLQRLQYKSYLLTEENRNKVETRLADALHTSWSNQMDLVILGSNCFYELATAETQEICIRKA
jgi:SAM-dependent methyltransferase